MERVEKEFHLFADKIAKLESLKQELGALKGNGFDSEIKFIRAKMIDVNSLSEVKKEIEKLRKKIQIKKNSGFQINFKKLNKESISQKEKKINKDIIDKKKSFEEQIKIKKDSFMGNHLSLISRLKKEESSLELEFNKRKKQLELALSKKSGLMKEEREKKELEIKQEKEKLEIEFKNRKNELNKRSKEMQESLKKQHLEFSAKLHDEYQKKIHIGLKNKITHEFNKKLNEKLNSVKAKVIIETKKKVLDSMKEEVEKKKEILESEFKKRNEELVKKGKLMKQEENRAISKNTKLAIDVLKIKMQKEFIEHLKAGLEQKEKVIRKELISEYADKLKKDLEVQNTEINHKKLKLEKQIINQVKLLFD